MVAANYWREPSNGIGFEMYGGQYSCSTGKIIYRIFPDFAE
jgi:hypothetical protein